jgi:RNA polymerase sigma-70 factor (ECF subfamily)
MDEQQAIALLKQGDLTGLEFLVQQHQAKAVHTAYLIIGDLACAEDVVQTTFLRVAQKIGQFDAQRSFRPWFLRAVVNNAIKAAKGQKRLVSLDEPSPAVLAWLNDPAKAPEELVEAAELRQMVWNALQQLNPEQRAAIIQRHFLEMDEAEMVEQLQRPASTVKWWLHTARERLRALLSPYRGETSGENHEKR